MKHSRPFFFLLSLAAATLLAVYLFAPKKNHSPTIHSPTPPPLSSSSQKNPPATTKKTPPPTLSSPSYPFPPFPPRNPQSFDLIAEHGGPVPHHSTTPAAKRTNQVSLNPSLLSSFSQLQKGDSLSISLFDDVRYQTTVSNVQTWGNGTVAVDATIPGNPNSYVYLACTNGIARMLVKDRITGKSYQIRHDTAGGYHYSLEIDEAASTEAPCATDHLATVSSGLTGITPKNAATSPVLAYADSASPSPIPVTTSPPTASAAEVQTEVTVNFLALYTPAALAYEGSAENVANNISLAVQMGNTALTNSQTLLRLNLAHTALTTYTESGSGSTDLNNLTNTADGSMDEIHALRNTHSADFVSLFAAVNYGGLGWVPNDYASPSEAFNVVRIQQTDWTLTMIHELGHNMGNGHSATQTHSPGPGDIYTHASGGNFASGWQFADADAAPKTGFCSVMTYEDHNNDGTEEYERIEYFSNPNISYSGNPTGNAANADAARVIRNGRFAFGNYRGTYSSPTDTISSFPYTNSFEDFLGSWLQTSDDNLDWTGLCYGDTLQNPTGPSMGAQNGDYYIAVIAYDGTAHYSSTANLVANADFTGKTSAQISFYYHMYDGGTTHMGSLYCDVSTNNGGDWTNLWSISGTQGNIWHQATISLSAYDGMPVRLRLRAVTGPNFLSDICVDNLSISATLPVLFSSWISTNYASVSDPAPTSDPDGDGISNFLEYALALDPTTPDASSLPSVSMNAEGTALVLQFPRARATVRYTVQSTTDVSNWTTPTIEWDSGTPPPDLVAVGATQTVTIPLGASTKLFLRIHAEE